MNILLFRILLLKGNYKVNKLLPYSKVCVQRITSKSNLKKNFCLQDVGQETDKITKNPIFFNGTNAF